MENLISIGSVIFFDSGDVDRVHVRGVGFWSLGYRTFDIEVCHSSPDFT